MDNEQPAAVHRVTPRLLRVVQVVVMLVGGFLLGAHASKWDAVRVDAVTLGLLGILLVIPILDLVRKIKLGDFEAEIGRDEVIKAQARVAVDLPPEADADRGLSEESVRRLLREDPRLALAKVRIELEESLKRLYATVDPTEPERRLSLGRIVDTLVRREILSPSIGGALREVISLANRAVHGERIDPSATEELAMLGVRLTRELQQLVRERVTLPLESIPISSEDVDRYQASRYRVTTVVPRVASPMRNSYVLDQDALAEFLETYEEYAEFVVSIVPLEENE